MPTIHISEETYRRLQELAVPFQDREPEDVIRRLLSRTEVELPEDRPEGNQQRDLVSYAGRIPHGSKLRASYKGIEFEAEIHDATVLWNGREFDSVSSAAVAVIQSTGSPRPTENGWRFWEVRPPNSEEWFPGTHFRNR